MMLAGQAENGRRMALSVESKSIGGVIRGEFGVASFLGKRDADWLR